MTTISDKERRSETGAVLQDGCSVLCAVHPRGQALLAGAGHQMPTDPVAAHLRLTPWHESWG